MAALTSSRTVLSASLGFVVLLSSMAPLSEASSFGDEFWQHWGDGQAELAAYDLIYPRYGEDRQGTAVTIFVTETFSRDLRVKADPGVHPEADEVLVMKLNLIEDFPTGIYDYNLMTSTFVLLSDTSDLLAGTPIKTSFSGQEWCGHQWLQSLWYKNAVRIIGHSYFDGIADREIVLDRPPASSGHEGGSSADLLLLWARGLASPFLRSGESATISLLQTSEGVALRHEPAKFDLMELRRSITEEVIEVPAGSFLCDVHTAELAVPQAVPNDEEFESRSWKFWVERAAPHRLIRWETSSGKQASLVGVKRMAYWKLNATSGTQALKELGLEARGPRTP